MTDPVSHPRAACAEGQTEVGARTVWTPSDCAEKLARRLSRTVRRAETARDGTSTPPVRRPRSRCAPCALPPLSTALRGHGACPSLKDRIWAEVTMSGWPAGDAVSVTDRGMPGLVELGPVGLRHAKSSQLGSPPVLGCGRRGLPRVPAGRAKVDGRRTQKGRACTSRPANLCADAAGLEPTRDGLAGPGAAGCGARQRYPRRSLTCGRASMYEYGDA